MLVTRSKQRCSSSALKPHEANVALGHPIDIFSALFAHLTSKTQKNTPRKRRNS
jgi:hypothetical protein